MCEVADPDAASPQRNEFVCGEYSTRNPKLGIRVQRCEAFVAWACRHKEYHVSLRSSGQRSAFSHDLIVVTDGKLNDRMHGFGLCLPEGLQSYIIQACSAKMGTPMKRFIEGEDRSQSTLFPKRLDDYIAEDNPIRVIEVFVEELDLKSLGFEGMEPEVTGRPGYHPSTLLKIYIYGYLNRIQSSRRMEREAQGNVELIWLTGRLMPDFKTIADFRKDNGSAIRSVAENLSSYAAA
jgi:transposase